MQFKVKWEIDIIANSPQEAAMIALEIQRDDESTALDFDVYDKDGLKYRIDLWETDNA